MIMYQILFVSGVMLTIGLKSSLQFFMKRSNFKVLVSPFPSFSLFRHVTTHLVYMNFLLLFWFLCIQGTISFGFGFFFVIIGWPIIGMILEAYGFVVLFRFAYFFSIISCVPPIYINSIF